MMVMCIQDGGRRACVEIGVLGTEMVGADFPQHYFFFCFETVYFSH